MCVFCFRNPRSGKCNGLRVLCFRNFRSGKYWASHVVFQKSHVWEIMRFACCVSEISDLGNNGLRVLCLRNPRSGKCNVMHVVFQKSQVWEIMGAEFCRSNVHTAGGISIRFPRLSRIRDDKSVRQATDLSQLLVCCL